MEVIKVYDKAWLDAILYMYVMHKEGTYTPTNTEISKITEQHPKGNLKAT